MLILSSSVLKLDCYDVAFQLEQLAKIATSPSVNFVISLPDRVILSSESEFLRGRFSTCIGLILNICEVVLVLIAYN